MSGKSGGRVGGLTGGGSAWGLSSSGLGMALVLKDVRLTRVDPCLFRWASKHGQRGWHLSRPAGGHCSQRRHRGYAALRHDYRQGRQEGRVGASKRARQRPGEGLDTAGRREPLTGLRGVPAVPARESAFRAAFFFKRRNNTACAVFGIQVHLLSCPPALSAPCLPRLRVPARAGLFSHAMVPHAKNDLHGTSVSSGAIREIHLPYRSPHHT